MNEKKFTVQQMTNERQLQLRSLRLCDGMLCQQMLRFNEMMRLGEEKNEFLLTYDVYQIDRSNSRGGGDASG